MNQSINIADLVQPKFKPRQAVWAVARDYNGRVTKIWSVNIKRVGFNVSIYEEKGAEKRAITLHYFDYADNSYPEETLFESLDDLSEKDRKPVFG
jgi:hypothetical protein